MKRRTNSVEKIFQLIFASLFNGRSASFELQTLKKKSTLRTTLFTSAEKMKIYANFLQKENFSFIYFSFLGSSPRHFGHFTTFLCKFLSLLFVSVDWIFTWKTRAKVRAESSSNSVNLKSSKFVYSLLKCNNVHWKAPPHSHGVHSTTHCNFRIGNRKTEPTK